GCWSFHLLIGPVRIRSDSSVRTRGSLVQTANAARAWIPARARLTKTIGLEIMKTRCSKLARFFSVLWLIVWAVGPRASAQAPPSLGLRFSAGQPTLSL